MSEECRGYRVDTRAKAGVSKHLIHGGRSGSSVRTSLTHMELQVRPSRRSTERKELDDNAAAVQEHRVAQSSAMHPDKHVSFKHHLQLLRDGVVFKGDDAHAADAAERALDLERVEYKPTDSVRPVACFFAKQQRDARLLRSTLVMCRFASRLPAVLNAQPSHKGFPEQHPSVGLRRSGRRSQDQALEVHTSACHRARPDGQRSDGGQVAKNGPVLNAGIPEQNAHGPTETLLCGEAMQIYMSQVPKRPRRLHAASC